MKHYLRPRGGYNSDCNCGGCEIRAICLGLFSDPFVMTPRGGDFEAASNGDHNRLPFSDHAVLLTNWWFLL